jgi:hypothetical protein
MVHHAIMMAQRKAINQMSHFLRNVDQNVDQTAEWVQPMKPLSPQNVDSIADARGGI